MTFLKYLFEQALLGILVGLAMLIGYSVSYYFGFREATQLTIQDIIFFYVVFVVIGSSLRYAFKFPPRF